MPQVSNEAIIELPSLTIDKQTEKAFRTKDGSWWPKSVVKIAHKEPLDDGHDLVTVHAPAWFLRKNDLASEQWIAAHVVEEPKAPEVADKPRGKTIGSVAGIIALFDAAKQHLKYPEIRLTVADQPIKIKPAKAGGKNHGCVYVSDATPHADRCFGKVTPEGTFEPYKGVGDLEPMLVDFLEQLSDDPAGIAAAYGKLAGKCCFCGIPLTDPKSTAVGYGPHCASHYNLPWGEKK